MIGRTVGGLAWVNPRIEQARLLLSYHAARVILSCYSPQAAATAVFLVLGLFLRRDNVGTLQSITPAEVTL